MAVAVGRISRLRLVDRSLSPSITPIWGSRPDTSRDIGDQTTVSSLPRMRLAIWNPQRWVGLLG